MCVCVRVCIAWCVCSISVGSQLPANYRRVVLWYRRVQRALRVSSSSSRVPFSSLALLSTLSPSSTLFLPSLSPRSFSIRVSAGPRIAVAKFFVQSYRVCAHRPGTLKCDRPRQEITLLLHRHHLRGDHPANTWSPAHVHRRRRRRCGHRCETCPDAIAPDRHDDVRPCCRLSYNMNKYMFDVFLPPAA